MKKVENNYKMMEYYVFVVVVIVVVAFVVVVFVIVVVVLVVVAVCFVIAVANYAAMTRISFQIVFPIPGRTSKNG